MTKEQSKQLGQAIGFSLCGIMAILTAHALLRAMASTAHLFL
jgi:hypothetical protein